MFRARRSPQRRLMRLDNEARTREVDDDLTYAWVVTGDRNAVRRQPYQLTAHRHLAGIIRRDADLPTGLEATGIAGIDASCRGLGRFGDLKCYGRRDVLALSVTERLHALRPGDDPGQSVEWARRDAQVLLNEPHRIVERAVGHARRGAQHEPAAVGQHGF